MIFKGENMETKRYKPRFDKTYIIIYVATNLFLIAALLIPMLIDPHVGVMILFAVTLLFVNYFIVSPMLGYVELRDESLYIRFGFILKREIPYSKIRGIDRHRKFYADSMISLKNALDHINVKYNSFDMVSLSVKDEDDFITELCRRAGANIPVRQTIWGSAR